MTAGDTPLLVVDFVVGGIVVPSASVGFENRALRHEREIEVVGAPVPIERKLANEIGHAVRDQQPASFDFQRRTRRMNRIKFA